MDQLRILSSIVMRRMIKEKSLFVSLSVNEGVEGLEFLVVMILLQLFLCQLLYFYHQRMQMVQKLRRAKTCQSFILKSATIRPDRFSLEGSNNLNLLLQLIMQ